MRLFYLFFVSLLVFPFAAFSNGGPVDGSEFYATGNIVPLRKADVRILSEDLRIRIIGDSGFVDVTYVLLNEQSEAQDVLYGFPVDVSASESYTGRWLDSLQDDELQLFVNGIEVTTGFWNEPNRARHDSFMRVSGKQKWMDQILFWRRWHTAKISLPAGKPMSVRVTFRVRNGFVDWGTSKSFFTNYDDRRMLYDFTPASYWGKGVAEKFTLRINAQPIVYNGGTIRFEGMSLRQENIGMYAYDGTNVKLGDLGRLRISYDISLEKNKTLLSGKLNMNKHIRAVNVSSKLGVEYDAAKLADGNLSTCWAEGVKGAGEGQTITIDFDTVISVAAVVIVNGYAKSEELFYKNNRVKKIRVEQFCSLKDCGTRTPQESELPDSTWSSVKPGGEWAASSVAFDGGDWFGRATQLRITVLEAYRGSKHNDTCISEIYVIGYDKEQ